MSSPRDWLRLARVPLAPTAAFDAVACALLARGPGLTRGAPALSARDGCLLAATSVLVYSAGMTMNDVADRRRDRTIHPERPIPSGRVSALAATLFAALAAGGAVALGGGPAGERLGVVAAVLFAFAYDGTPRRLTAVGALLMGLTRAANAAIGVVPPLLSGTTHPLSLAGPLVVGLYSAGITAHSASEGLPVPRASTTRFMRAASFLSFGGAGALSLLGGDGLTLGAFCAPAFLLSIAFLRVPRLGPVRAQVLELLLGFYWLEAILATGGFAGSAWAPVLAIVLWALAAIWGSQMLIRALRPR